MEKKMETTTLKHFVYIYIYIAVIILHYSKVYIGVITGMWMYHIGRMEKNQNCKLGWFRV